MMKKLICLLITLIAFTNTASARSLYHVPSPLPGVFQLYAENPIQDGEEGSCTSYLELTIGNGGILGDVARVEFKYRMDPRALCAVPAVYNPYVRVFHLRRDLENSDPVCGGNVYVGSGVETWQNRIKITDFRGMACRKHFPNTVEVEITLEGETTTLYHNPDWL